MTASTNTATIPSGTTGASHTLTGPYFDHFTAGQTLWLSFWYSAIRTTGTNTMTLAPKLRWFNSSGAELSPTTSPTININASTTDWVFVENGHTVPATAVQCRVEFVATPAASPMQHTLSLAKMRVCLSQTLANYVTNTNQLFDGAGLGTTATWSNVSGPNRPADNATANNVTRSSSAPSGGNDGDIWVYTAVNPNVTYIKVGGVWQISANYTTNTNQLTDGAGLGTTATWNNVGSRPANLAGLTGGEFIRNSDISIASGAIQGIGSGNATMVANTSIGVSSGSLTGIGSGNGTMVANTYVPIGANQLVNSDFTKGWLGFMPSVNGGSTGGYNGLTGINTLTSAYSGMRNVLQGTLSTGGAAWPNGAGYYWDVACSKGIWNGTSLADLYQYGMRVKQGDNVYARCLGAQHRCNFQFYMLIFDKNGSLLEAPSWFGARDGGGIDGNPANFNVMGGSYTVANANSAYATLLFRMLSNGGSDPYIFVAEPAMGILQAGQAVLPAYTSGPSDSVLTVAGSGVQVGDQRNLLPITVAGTRYKFTGAITYASTAGSGAATISVAAGNLVLGSSSVSYSGMSTTVTGSVGTTVTYYLYVASGVYTAGGHSLNATTDGNLIYSADGIAYLGSITVTYATAGGGGTGGGGDGGGTGCVAEDSWVETQNRGWLLARDVQEGDYLRCLNESTMDGTVWLRVMSNHTQLQPSHRIVSESGITLRCSDSTPLTLKDGSYLHLLDLDGHELPVQDEKGFRWERCTLEPLGFTNVCYISLGGYVYAAGDVKGRSILTHNPTSIANKP